MKFLKNSLLLSALISLLLLPVTATAVGSEDPYDKIEKITQELIHIIGLHQKDYPSNEKQYFAALTELLSDTVDFNYISKKVMGSYRANITPVQRVEFADKLDYLITLMDEDEVDFEKLQSSTADTIALFEQEVSWRKNFKKKYMDRINAHDKVISETIGLRLQSKLTKEQAIYVSKCNSIHRDISLNF